MTTQQHTPTPWINSGKDRDERLFLEHDQGGELYSHIVFDACTDNDVAFIVRACNAHDSLVAALDALMGRTFLITGPDAATDRAMRQAREALKLARGEP